MEISTETENVLSYLDSAAGEGLRKRNDLGTILELAAAGGAPDAVNDLAFQGSFLYQLYQTLRRTTPGAEGYAALEKEFAAGIERLRELVSGLLVEAPEEQIERFNEVYYQATQGSVRNLLDLAHDLGVLKSVQNEQRYR